MQLHLVHNAAMERRLLCTLRIVGWNNCQYGCYEWALLPWHAHLLLLAKHVSSQVCSSYRVHGMIYLPTCSMHVLTSPLYMLSSGSRPLGWLMLLCMSVKLSAPASHCCDLYCRGYCTSALVSHQWCTIACIMSGICLYDHPVLWLTRPVDRTHVP